MSCIGTVCLVAAQLTAFDATYDNPMPATAMSYDGVSRDVSRFYRDEQTNFNIHGHMTLNTGTRIYLGYDNGIDTAKFDVSKSYTIAFAQIIKENWIISAGTKIGGKARHTPCTDSFGREYLCANLTAWSDFKEMKHETPYNFGIKYIHRF